MQSNLAIGNLTRDPELRFIPGSGKAVTRFSIAVDGGKTSSGEDITDFIPFEVWGKQAENLANYKKKGEEIAVQYIVKNNNYEKEGSKIYAFKFVATRIKYLRGAGSNSSGGDSNYNNDLPDGFQPVDDDDIPF